MYILQNAFANIKRNKGRNLLIGLILFIMLLTCTISIAIYRSSSTLIEETRSSLSSSVIIVRNDEKLPKDAAEYKEPNKADYERFANSSLLKNTSMKAVAMGSLSNGKAIDEDSGNMGGALVDEGAEDTTSYKMSTNSFYGVAENEFDQLFNGTRTLIKGKSAVNEKEAVISKELAELNHWDLEDTFEANIVNYDTMKQETITLTIVGIYENSASPYNSEEEKGFAQANKNNEILLSLDTVLQAGGDRSVLVDFTIKDPQRINDLGEEFHAMGLPQYFDVKVDDALYKKSVMPVEGMQSITLTFTLAIIIAGSLILMILSNLAIHERIYEIGILRAMGLKKKKIALGFFYEMLILCSISLILAFTCASGIKEPIANALYQSQTEMNSSTNEDLSIDIYAANTTFEKIEVSLDFDTISWILIISLLLTISSSIIGIHHAYRFEPLKILSERN